VNTDVDQNQIHSKIFVQRYSNPILRFIRCSREKCELFGIQFKLRGTAVVQWLRCCATYRKVAGSNPDGVTGIFH